MDSILDTGTRKRLESTVLAAMSTASERGMIWGEDDCALWCANIVRECLAYDPAAEWRGRYKTRRGAMRVLGKGGIKKALDRAARRHEWKRIAPTMARPGDVGLAWTMYEGRPVLATVICRATGYFVGRNEGGFTALPASQVAIAWAILPDHTPGHRVTLRQYSASLAKPPTAIPQEPVSVGLGILSLLGVGTTSTLVAGLVGGIALGALSVGVSMLSSLLQPQRGVGSIDATLSDTSHTSAVQITERQSIPFKRVIVGKAFVGGPIFFEQVKPPYLTMGVLLSDGPITGIEKTYIGTNEIVFDAFAANTILTPKDIDGQPNYPNRLRICYRYGATDQAVDPLILNKYASIGSEFRQRGIATFVGEYHFGSNQDEFLSLWGQVSRPNAYHIVRGVAVYDPRDPSQDMNDESTWQWSNNASLIQAWYLTRSYGCRIPMSTIDWDKVADAANYDDEVIGCGDGTFIKRHTIDGVITLNQRPYEVMQKLLTANAGLLLESAGKVWVSSSRPRTPIATIHDGILAGSFRYQAAKNKRNLVNKLQVRAVAPGQDYQLVDGPILSRSDLQTADGEVLPATLALEYTLDESTNWTRVQRLQKMFLERARLGRTINCTVDIRLLTKAADELIGNVVTVDSHLFGIVNGDYLVTSVGISDDMNSVTLALTEYSATVENEWNPETDEQAFTLADLNIS